MAWDIPNIIINLRKEIEESSGDVTDLETRVGTLESTVSPLPGRIDALEEDLDATPVSVTGTTIEIDGAAAIPAESLTMEVVPTQELHGFNKPWAGGAGKNKLPIVLSDIKSANTGGTWSGNVYTINDGTITVLTDDADNVLGFKANGTFSAQTGLVIISGASIAANNYILNGAPSGSGYSSTWLNIKVGSANYNDIGSGTSATISASDTVNVTCYIANGANIDNMIFKPMLRLSTETDATFDPYSNICPITGKSSAKIETTDGETTNDAEVSLGATVYAGEIDFNEGTGTSTMANIASYDGETIGEPWLSSMDEYTEGGTPTTGAQVVYTLETPTALSFTADKLTLLEGEQTVTGNGGGDITLSYQKDNLIGDLKKWILANT